VLLGRSISYIQTFDNSIYEESLENNIENILQHKWKIVDYVVLTPDSYKVQDLADCLVTVAKCVESTIGEGEYAELYEEFDWLTQLLIIIWWIWNAPMWFEENPNLDDGI